MMRALTSKTLLALFVLFVGAVSIAEAQTQEFDFSNISWAPTAFTIAPGRVLFTQIVPPTNPEAVTFLFMPGVNRSVLVDEEAVQELIKRGFGVVTFNFSTQPLSVALLGENERAYFLDNELTLKDLAEETEALAKSLKKEYGMEKIIPVSLSYSGAVSAYLKDFPLVIETAPMTSNAAVNPQAEAFRQSVIASQFFNPFFGPAIVRSTMDNVYRANWAGQVTAMSKQFGFAETSAMVEGYTMMSRAAEDFTWVDAEKEIKGRRLFLVAENEGVSLKKDQLDTFKTLNLKGEVVIVEKSGHIIPFDQPKIYSDILDRAAQDTFPQGVKPFGAIKKQAATVNGKCGNVFLN